MGGVHSNDARQPSTPNLQTRRWVMPVSNPFALLYGGGQRIQQLHNNLWTSGWACAVVLNFMLYTAAKNTFLEEKYNHMITFC